MDVFKSAAIVASWRVCRRQLIKIETNRLRFVSDRNGRLRTQAVTKEEEKRGACPSVRPVRPSVSLLSDRSVFWHLGPVTEKETRDGVRNNVR